MTARPTAHSATLMTHVEGVRSPWVWVLSTVRLSMTNRIVDRIRTPGRPRLVRRAMTSHTPALIRAPAIVALRVAVAAAPCAPYPAAGYCCRIRVLSAGVVATAVRMLKAARALPAYISRTALIMDRGGTGRPGTGGGAGAVAGAWGAGAWGATGPAVTGGGGKGQGVAVPVARARQNPTISLGAGRAAGSFLRQRPISVRSCGGHPFRSGGSCSTRYETAAVCPVPNGGGPRTAWAASARGGNTAR